MNLPRIVAAPLVALTLIGVGRGDPSTADHWIALCPDAERVLLDAAGVAARNRRMLDGEPSIVDLARLPATFSGAEVAARIRKRSRLPDGPAVSGDGVPVADDDRHRWQAALALDALPERVEPRYGLVVRRAAVRRFPTRDRVHARAADTDIDQFQETAFFPGTPVAAVHTSADGDWRYVLGPTYDGWIDNRAVAFGPRDDVVAYAARATRVVTGARAATAFTPDLPAASQVALDMGTTLPERRDWPADEAVNGQSAVVSVVVELPVRDPDGGLRIVPALVPRSADTHDGPLPATRANVLRQAFKFLGERYGWGHDFDGRDCSGFVSDVYRSLGILLPRNTADQSTCPALAVSPLAADCPRDRRIAALDALDAGDLVFTRRHVMMVLGRDDRGPWVIHDTRESRAGRTAVNGVVVQSLQSLGGGTIDAVTAVVRVLPPPTQQPPPTPGPSP